MTGNNFPDFMVDLETTGTDPCNTAIVQIACVAFNIDTKEVCPDFFNMSLRIPPTRRWDEDTRIWWGKRPAVYQRIISTSQDPRAVMNAFFAWVQSKTSDDGPRLWGKPISFEAPFIESYFREFEIQNPFSFREIVDMRTFIRTKLGAWNINAWEKQRPLVGVAHDAIYDALHQTKLVLEASGN